MLGPGTHKLRGHKTNMYHKRQRRQCAERKNYRQNLETHTHTHTTCTIRDRKQCAERKNYRQKLETHTHTHNMYH